MDAPIPVSAGSIENGTPTDSTDELIAVALRLNPEQRLALVKAAREMSEDPQ